MSLCVSLSLTLFFCLTVFPVEKKGKTKKSIQIFYTPWLYVFCRFFIFFVLNIFVSVETRGNFVWVWEFVFTLLVSVRFWISKSLFFILRIESKVLSFKNPLLGFKFHVLQINFSVCVLSSVIWVLGSELWVMSSWFWVLGSGFWLSVLIFGSWLSSSRFWFLSFSLDNKAKSLHEKLKYFHHHVPHYKMFRFLNIKTKLLTNTKKKTFCLGLMAAINCIRLVETSSTLTAPIPQSKHWKHLKAHFEKKTAVRIKLLIKKEKKICLCYISLSINTRNSLIQTSIWFDFYFKYWTVQCFFG